MILKVKREDGTEEMRYMGKWGELRMPRKVGLRRIQSADVKGVDPNGMARFSYDGKHTDTIANGITVNDVQWLLTYLGAITDDQIRTGLKASGANQHEVDCFTSSIRSRIEQLRRILPN